MKLLTVTTVLLVSLSALALPQEIEDVMSQQQQGGKVFIQTDCVDRGKVHADVYAAFRLNPVLNNKEFLFKLIDRVMEADRLKFCDELPKNAQSKRNLG